MAEALINLLPDSKQQRIKAEQTSRMAVGIGIIVSITAVAIPVVMFIYLQGQNLLIGSAQRDIDENIAAIQEAPNIDTILTTQAHLESLPALYDQRRYATAYLRHLGSVMPTQVKLANLEVTPGGSVTFTGTTRKNADVQKFYEKLATVTASVDEDVPGQPVYTDLVLETISPESSGSVLFQISGVVNQEVFDEL